MGLIKKPSCMVLANGNDITGLLMGLTDSGDPRLIRLSIRDQRGYESDSLDIEIDDSDAKFAYPKKGAELDVYLGYEKEDFNYKGKYIVDEITHDGPPDKITITAKAANMLKSLKIRKNRSWSDTTLEAVVNKIAAEHTLKAGIGKEFVAIDIKHIDQAESDMHFLTRLGKKHDAVVKPTAGNLLFVKKGASTAVSGTALPLIEINRTDCSSHTFIEKGRTEHTGVKVFWHDKATGKRQPIIIGSSKNLKTNQENAATEAEAKQQAQAELDKLQRDGSTLELTLDSGKPELVAESRVNTTDFRSYIDREWVIKEVEHELSGTTGLSTHIQLETPNG